MQPEGDEVRRGIAGDDADQRRERAEAERMPRDLAVGGVADRVEVVREREVVDDAAVSGRLEEALDDQVEGRDEQGPADDEQRRRHESGDDEASSSPDPHVDGADLAGDRRGRHALNFSQALFQSAKVAQPFGTFAGITSSGAALVRIWVSCPYGYSARVALSISFTAPGHTAACT